MILCVTPNPALDRTVFVDRLRPGEVHAGLRSVAAAGGKGVNVARAIRRLGRDALAVGPLGGPTGERVAASLEAEAVPARWVPIAGDTRTCTIVATGDGSTTVLNEAAPAIGAMEWRGLVEAVAAEAPDAACVTISGSVPDGVDAAGIRALIGAAGSAPGVWVDTSGPALAAAIGSGVNLKVNHLEAAEALGRGATGPDDPVRWAADAAGQLAAPLVAITLGDAGAVLRADGDVWHAAAPRVETANPVASGDAFLAGLVVGIVEGDPPSEALQLAVACGAANAASTLGADITLRTVERLRLHVVLERLS